MVNPRSPEASRAAKRHILHQSATISGVYVIVIILAAVHYFVNPFNLAFPEIALVTSIFLLIFLFIILGLVVGLYLKRRREQSDLRGPPELRY